VISVAVRWYLRYGLSYRDVEELLGESGVTVDHVTIYRWVQRFTPEFIEAARSCRHTPPSALHTVQQYANNPIEADHGRLKARMRPMRGLKRSRSARTLAAGHAFVQNLRRGPLRHRHRRPRPPQAPHVLRGPRNDHLTSEAFG
jgi:transposase-like protein